jgi:transposase-like protein
MNNVLEQDHRYVKKRVVASQWFRSVDGALNTIAGYEAMNIIARARFAGCRRPTLLVRCVERTFGIAA